MFHLILTQTQNLEVSPSESFMSHKNNIIKCSETLNLPGLTKKRYTRTDSNMLCPVFWGNVIKSLCRVFTPASIYRSKTNRLSGVSPSLKNHITELRFTLLRLLKSARTVGAKGRVFPEALTQSALAGGGPYFACKMHGTFIKHRTAFLGPDRLPQF